jgi:uncharacterized protein YegL
MQRLGLVLALLFLLPLIPVADASTPPPRSVWTVFVTVEADVEDHYATVRVIADIGNRGPDPEFPMLVQVPEGGFVTGLTITRDGVTHEADIMEREEARAKYDAHKSQEETGGLIEKQRGSQLYAYLINVAEFTNVRAVLSYEVFLGAERGLHELALEAPVAGFGQDLGAAFEVSIRHSDGVTGAWSEPGAAPRREGNTWHLSHRVPARSSDASTPFLVQYTVTSAPAGSIQALVRGGEGSFIHRFSAPADAAALPLDLVLVLDVSGSMSGQKMEQLRDAALQVVQALGAKDRLAIVPFSSQAVPSWTGMKAMDADGKSAAVDAVQGLFAAGSTNIEAGLERGFAALGASERVPVLVVLTDGQPTRGIQDAAELRQFAKAQNKGDATVYGIAFGADAAWSLIAGLAQDGGGTALRVADGAGAETDIGRFLQALSTPVLRDVKVTYASGIQAYRVGADVLFAGSELLIVGTFPGELKRITGTVSAIAPDGPRTYAFDAAVPTAGAPQVLPRAVAYHRIMTLEDARAAESSAATDKLLLELALKHGFVTDLTSLVVTVAAREFVPVPLGSHWMDADSAGGAPLPSWSGSGGTTTATHTSAPATATHTSAPYYKVERTRTEGHYGNQAGNEVGNEVGKEVGKEVGQPGQDGANNESDNVETTEPVQTPGVGGFALLAGLAALAAVVRRRMA